MKQLEIRSVKDEETDELVELWERVGITRPTNDPIADIALASRGEDFDILVGFDGHRGWVYYVAVDVEQQNSGLGRVMMDEAEKWLRLRSIPKMNLMVRSGNKEVIGFYEKLGYHHSDVVSLQKQMG